MSTNPRISVIVPTYNRRNYVLEALDSIRKQDFRDIEIVVVDDGSTDGTFEELSKLADIKLIRQTNQGPSAARNRGLSEATAPLLAFLDSDDLWPEGSLMSLLDSLQESAQVVMGHVQPIDSHGKPCGPTRTGAFLGAGIYRREVFDAVGGFDIDRTSWEDLDWLNKASEAGFARQIISPTTLLYRVHQNNMSSDVATSHAGLLGAIHESLRRRREVESESNR